MSVIFGIGIAFFVVAAILLITAFVLYGSYRKSKEAGYCLLGFLVSIAIGISLVAS